MKYETCALHPLHSAKFVSETVLNTNRLPGVRMTGRTTAAALMLIAECMRSPGSPHLIRDHAGTKPADALMKRVIEEMLSNLDFRYFTIRTGPDGWTLCFGEQV